MTRTPTSLLERLRQPLEPEAWGRFVALYTPSPPPGAGRSACRTPTPPTCRKFPGPGANEGGPVGPRWLPCEANRAHRAARGGGVGRSYLIGMRPSGIGWPGSRELGGPIRSMTGASVTGAGAPVPCTPLPQEPPAQPVQQSAGQHSQHSPHSQDSQQAALRWHRPLSQPQRPEHFLPHGWSQHGSHSQHEVQLGAEQLGAEQFDAEPHEPPHDAEQHEPPHDAEQDVTSAQQAGSQHWSSQHETHSQQEVVQHGSPPQASPAPQQDGPVAGASWRAGAGEGATSGTGPAPGSQVVRTSRNAAFIGLPP